MSHAWIIAAWAAGALFLLWVYASANLYFTQDRRFFVSDGAPFGPSPAIQALGGKPVSAERGGQLLRWHEVPAEGGERAWAIQYHGNMGGADERADYARELRKAGLRVFLVEYPSYAGGQGAPTQAALLPNSLAAFDEIASRAGGKKIFLVGESLGTGPATYVAAQRQVAALLLSTPYPSMVKVASHRFPTIPMDTLVRHRMEAWRWAPDVKCPVLALHGGADKVIPLRFGREQAAHFSPAPRFIDFPGVGHGEIRERPEYWQAMRDFLEGQLAQG